MDNVTPKKSLGQHWLHDDDALDAMCKAVQAGSEDAVLEIGPGLGTLTSKLLARTKKVVAVEYDATLAAALPSRLNSDRLTVVQEDILQFDFASMEHPYKVVANIPYYLTSNLIRVMSETANPPSAAALLIQKEVAERVCAEPGGLSILGVTAQFYWEAALGRVVPADLFTPPPKVDSQILILRYRGQPRFADVDPKLFFRLVKAGFSQKRKTLQNALSGGLALPKDETKRLLESAGIAPTIRAQALSLDDWHALYRVFTTQ